MKPDTTALDVQRITEALTEIRKMAQDHPAFFVDAFTERDIDALVKEGGDVCDWTMIAIIADDALNQNDQGDGPDGQ